MGIKIKKDALTEEELNKINGGNGINLDPSISDPSMFDVDRSVPDWCTPIKVEDGGNGSALCPNDGEVLDNANHAPVFADWLFHCKTCGKWFSKKRSGQWYVSDREPF